MVVSYLFGIFFFKQKTAYEMRISDWSSDVCSSDLELIVPPIVMDDHPNLAALCGNRGVVELGAGKGVHVHRLADQRAGDDVRQAEARLLHVQIGRASCRERGCQYV